LGIPSKCIIFYCSCTRLPRWHDLCYCTSRELCSNYF